MGNFSGAKTILRHAEFLEYKPLVLLRLISGFFKKNILKRNVLRTVDLAITGDCHYKCIFCSACRIYKKGGPFLTVGQIKDIWKQCVELGAMHVNLTGGEPFLRDIDETRQIISNFKPWRFLVSLVTCGLGLTKEKLKKLKNAGLDTLQLSIESTVPRIHDGAIGIEGSFYKVIEGVRYAKELGLRVCLNSVFYNGNAQEIRKLIDFSKRERVFLVLNTASTEGKWHGDNHKRLRQEDAAIFEDFLHFSHVRHDSSVNFSGRRECPGGKERIHITAYGDILTCPLVQISYGNVLEEPLKDIYQRINKIDYLLKYSRLCKHAFDSGYYNDILSPIEKIEDRPVLFYNHPLFAK